MSKFDEAAPERTGKKVADVLKFGSKGLSVEDAKKAMLAAGEAPRGMVARPPEAPLAAAEPVVPAAAPVAPVIPAEVDDFADEIPAAPAAASAAPAIPAAPVAAPPAAPAPASVPQKIERVENAQFTAEIKQENGKWTAEIRYKNGAGTEKFIKNTKNELMLALLEGKGNATLRVNKAVRREKLGFSELDRQYPLPEGITVKDFDEMPDKAQDALLWSVANNQVIMFRDAHPEFYRTDANKQKLLDFLNKEKLPITKRNLDYALDELSDPNLPVDVRLEEAPAPVSVAPATPSLEQPAPVTAPARTDSAPAAPVVAAASAATTPAAPAVVVRKRGTTGLRPGDSSVSTELGSTPEGGGEPRQLSQAELRKLPLPELKRIADAERRRNSAQR
jgi:hypothetical protein